MLRNKQEAAEFLNVSERTVERYVKTKKLKVKQYEQVAGKDSPMFEVVELQRFVSDRDTPKAKAIVVTDSDTSTRLSDHSDRKKNKRAEIVIAQTRKITTTRMTAEKRSIEKIKETIATSSNPFVDLELLQKIVDARCWLPTTGQLAAIIGISPSTLKKYKTYIHGGYILSQEIVGREYKSLPADDRADRVDLENLEVLDLQKPLRTPIFWKIFPNDR